MATAIRSVRDPWHRAERGLVNRRVVDYVSAVEQAQFDLFDRFVRLECLYDPNGPTAQVAQPLTDVQRGVTENVIATNVDTVSAAISTVDVRARFMTDGADWSEQRTARHLEWYIEGVAKRNQRAAKCRAAFKSAAKKGTGLIKVSVAFDAVRVEHVLVDDIIVDERACRNGAAPREMHQRRFVDRDELAAMFPEHDGAIWQLQPGGAAISGHATGQRLWAGYRPYEDNEIPVIESWKMPVGVEGKEGYRPGRHTIVAEGLDLLDEEWTKPFFPFAKIVWTERDAGWYGISLAERIAGHQRALNRRNRVIERSLDLNAFPVTYVRQADANIAHKTMNHLGTIAVYKSDAPLTVTPPAVHKETYQSRVDLREGAAHEAGVNQMAMHGAKPAGLDSGVALREYRDATTQRFSIQEQAFEQLNLDVDWLILDACKDLGKAAPVIMRNSKFGARRVRWQDVDMGDVKVQIVAASTLPRTPSGRSQLVLEWAQAGIISQDSARRLVGHPDVEKEWSLYTAALESVEHAIDEIEDGRVVVPEPFDNLTMIQWRGQQRYLQIRDLGAPEEILEALRQYVVVAAWMQGQIQGPAQAAAADVAALPADQTGSMPTQPMPEMAIDPGAIQAAYAMQPGAPPPPVNALPLPQAVA